LAFVHHSSARPQLQQAMCQAHQTQLPWFVPWAPSLQQMQKLAPPQEQVSCTPPHHGTAWAGRLSIEVLAMTAMASSALTWRRLRVMACPPW
jgi:hypothetical protein